MPEEWNGGVQINEIVVRKSVVRDEIDRLMGTRKTNTFEE